MSPARFIRTRVFGMSQDEFAASLSTTQATISRSERRGYLPTDLSLRVLALADQLHIQFEHRWFFEVPNYQDAQEDKAA